MGKIDVSAKSVKKRTAKSSKQLKTLRSNEENQRETSLDYIKRKESSQTTRAPTMSREARNLISQITTLCDRIQVLPEEEDAQC